LALLAAIAALSSACRTATPDIDPLQLESARGELLRPLPADPSLLYGLRVSSRGGLRLSILTSGEAGRLTISERFGSALSITAWRASSPPVFFDLRESCRLKISDLSQVLGVGAMPLPQAVRLLVGRIPAVADDTVSFAGGASFLVEGNGWAAQVEVAADPWRVVGVREVGESSSGWTIVLENHTGPIPGSIRVKRSDGRRAELELLRLEWHEGGDLPDLPALPLCVAEDGP
jgi:hypothetical protein